MNEERNTLDRDTPADAPAVEEVVSKVRAFVRTLLNCGAESPDITFSLVYVATEFGLAVAEESVQVFPVVLSAVTNAAINHGSLTDGTDAGSSEVGTAQEGKPHGATLH